MSGKVVVTEFITLDGVIQDPGGSGEYDRGGWSFEYNRGDDGDKFKLDELMAADAQLLGRITYVGFAAAWPTMEDEKGFADKMNSMPKYVVYLLSQLAQVLVHGEGDHDDLAHLLHGALEAGPDLAVGRPVLEDGRLARLGHAPPALDEAALPQGVEALGCILAGDPVQVLLGLPAVRHLVEDLGMQLRVEHHEQRHHVRGVVDDLRSFYVGLHRD
jgi:hypothetical protein